MVCWVRRFRAGALALGLTLGAGCDDSDATSASPSGGDDDSSADTESRGSDSDASTSGTPTGATSSTPTSDAGPTSSATDPTSDSADPTTDPTDGSGSESGEGPVPSDGWVEIGYGLDAFFPFEGELPVTRGPQGSMMFSLPLRGSDFPVAPDPFDFDHPDTPILSVWTDIEGIPSEHPSGHFAAFLNYPVPFTLSDDPDVDYEFVSVWLVIPEIYPPEELAGREAIVHAELACSDGQLLIDEHTLTVIDGTVDAGGKGKE